MARCKHPVDKRLYATIGGMRIYTVEGTRALYEFRCMNCGCTFKEKR